MSAAQIDTATFSTSSAKMEEFPVYEATIGRPAIGISSLFSQGYTTFDPGYFSTAVCESSITSIQGDIGELLYRGYPIDELAERYTFPAISQLLLTGTLSVDAGALEYANDLDARSAVPQPLTKLIAAMPQDAHPMAMLMSAVAALEGFYPELCDVHDPDSRLQAAKLLIALIPKLAILCAQRSRGEQVAPSMTSSTSYSGSFLQGLRQSDEIVNPTFEHAIDKILTVHADHELNASTATVRAVGSTGANLFASIAAGIAALWGPLHGGANEACLKMLRLMGSEEHVDQYVRRAKDPDDHFKLMGFGHRVYKNYDPRAKIMRTVCQDVLSELGRDDEPLLKLATKLEKIALEDPYFVERKLYPNVDFYSGITQNALGIEDHFFTVVFAVARTTGWASHWLEMHETAQTRICRPRQIYVGETRRNTPDPASTTRS